MQVHHDPVGRRGCPQDGDVPAEVAGERLPACESFRFVARQAGLVLKDRSPLLEVLLLVLEVVLPTGGTSEDTMRLLSQAARPRVAKGEKGMCGHSTLPPSALGAVSVIANSAQSCISCLRLSNRSPRR